MKQPIFTILLLLILWPMNAQEEKAKILPYHTIPPHAEAYTPGTVVARMIDGLGYRYYWATEGLRETDLEYRVVEGSRSVMELLGHIHGLSERILYAAMKQPVDRREKVVVPSDMAGLREETLNNLLTASNLMKESSNLAEHPLVFISDKGRSEFPFWNQVNGPIEDAVWHSGQIAMLRRANGNPMPPGVNVFTGQTKN